jgi:fructose-bisphosphate aldolase class II
MNNNQSTNTSVPNIERISEIKHTAGVFITLHGGSGTDDEDLRRGVAAGINIIHINTELRVSVSIRVAPEVGVSV